MKVLFAPQNTASIISTLITGLKKLPDVEIKGVSLSSSKYWADFSSEWVVLENQVPWRKQPFKRLKQTLHRNYVMIKSILWADVIHWVWDIKGLTLFDIHYWLILLLRKPVVIEWVGSEIRKPDFLSSFNKYYKQVWDSGEWEYKFENDLESTERQLRFKRINAIPAVCPEMSLYIDPAVFSRFYMLYMRVDISEYEVHFPSLHKTTPLVVHTPSAIGAKGTKYVRAIVQSLKSKGLNFEYREITNSSREVALQAMKEADIFLDHFIYGSYGMASCEAMALGKPVFSFIMPQVKALMPKDCPINTASLDTLEEQLTLYINDPHLRHETGKRSRAFVEQYHNTDTIAMQTLRLYEAMHRKDSSGIEALTSPTSKFSV